MISLVSLAIRFASESKPTLAMQRNRWPLASPTSIWRTSPPESTSTACSGSVGMPRTRARSLPRPPGMIPRGTSEPARRPPARPISPSPLMITGISPASAARRISSTACSRSRVLSTRKAIRRSSSAFSTFGKQLIGPAAACGRVEDQRQRRGVRLHRGRSLNGGGGYRLAATDEEGPRRLPRRSRPARCRAGGTSRRAASRACRRAWRRPSSRRRSRTHPGAAPAPAGRRTGGMLSCATRSNDSSG